MELHFIENKEKYPAQTTAKEDIERQANILFTTDYNMPRICMTYRKQELVEEQHLGVQFSVMAMKIKTLKNTEGLML